MLLLALGLLGLVPEVLASASCDANAGCAALLLAGNCCPTDDGITLGCCGANPQSVVGAPPSASPKAKPSPPPAPSPAPLPPVPSPSPPSPPSPPAAPGISLLGIAPLGGTELGGFTKASPHTQQPSKIWGETASAPLPTNRWWINLVLPDGDAVGTNVVSPLPYVVKALDDGLHACLPSKDASVDYVALVFDDTIILGAQEMKQDTGTAHTIAAHDDLSVTVQWDAGHGSSVSTPLVRGMPYVTAIYKKLTPQITFPTSPIRKVNGKSPGTATMSGGRFAFELANGQTWVLYADSKADVTIDGAAIKFASPYDGTLRVAAATSADMLDLLDTYATRVPLGGSVEGTAHGDVATLGFNFRARGAGELLLMALPHHLEAGHLSGVSRTALRHDTLKGQMVGVVGDHWKLTESLPATTWSAPRAIDPSRVDSIREALKADQEKPMLVPDPYGSGKEMGAVGRLVLIADELGEDATAAALRKRLSAKLEEWLTGKGADPLRYEPTYGGLSPANGLADRAADFGGGWYNDHHFHYGYFLYAAAAVGRKDPEWLKTWAPAISHLIRDIANPSSDDPLYSSHRFKDWYVGHSWASGLFPSASSRNQESVSEALNAWYGLALYGLALGDAQLRDLGRVMLATELRSGWKYWQIDEESTIYPEVFAKNGLAAVVWSTKVDKATWFGANTEYAYGIQAMPVTPITELWLRPRWLTSTQKIWGPSMDTATQQWRGIVLMMSAVITEPAATWKDAQTLSLFDGGNSRTNLLYWIATRATPDSLAALPSPTHAVPPSPPLQHDSHAGHHTTPEEDSAAEEPPPNPMPTILTIGGVLVAAALACSAGRRYVQGSGAGASATLPADAASESVTEYERLEDADTRSRRK